ncbi:GlxA family transcriptional regulator [Sulfitobacter donghicola]|uniref:AraC family transcriptional regulator n=1 Tax=Sulfitobacter donghicola DSW-25 = KCTC 12864 = JCM 14565 TaxID=1300350 RepID=A0A073IF21_9RHOB|nr:GlxA family transcriptional regulator [Sulfitobacter donghicola]KEJ88155.1 AraC family transcriptional regulator [Sulfitobacter donghicola DSW-25 = KCTC 12864 = JCM 14565]KIN70091.1 Transcriptional regulator, AraC family [Sulfitobacter donghicola DSW-25 = KCTC 12864 = JCM 14565]
MNKSEIQTIGFLLFPGFPMACLTSMIEPLRAANEIAQAERFAWQLVSETGERVMSSAQVSFEPNCSLADAEELDVIILLSSPMAHFENAKSSPAKLRRMERAGRVMGAVSGGVFPLVRAGLMQGHRCSVHWCYEAAFRAEFPDIEVTDDVTVSEKMRATASGAAAAFDLALHMIDNTFGADVAHEVACWFQHPLMRGKGVRQRVPMLDGTGPALPILVSKAAALFAQRIEDPISIAEVADALQVTPRQIERSFKKATGQSPTHYYRSLRMKAARQLVLYSKDTLPEIALAVGYSSTTPLVQHYRTAFGLSPQEDREQINDFRVQGNMPLPSI